jgi:hypothetical protein
VPQRSYTVAVRAVSIAGEPSPVVAGSSATGQQTFMVLHGCFVATAAYGAPGDRSVEVLRRLRDRRLLASPAGQLFVAAYYATSPGLAAAIASDVRLRALARAFLDPLVRFAARLR